MFKQALTGILVVAAVFLFSGKAVAAPIKADIVFIIDTSGSMGADIAQVKSRINDFNNAMINAGIDAHYGLVEFGGNSPNASTSNSARLTQNIVDFASFNAGGSPFQMLGASGGGNEPGSVGVLEALNEFFAPTTANYRNDAVKNLILITDEDDDSSLSEFNAANTALGLNNALFNFIGVPGTGNTNGRYGVLASENGGAAFSIGSFRRNPDPFFDSFIDTKVDEILNAPGVPEPASIAVWTILLLTIAAAVWYRRRKMVPILN